MKNKTKAELLTIIENLHFQLDIETDKAIIRKERIEELEEELEEKIELEDTLDIAKHLMHCIIDSRWKVSMGVRSQEEELEKLHDKLEEILS